MKKTHAILVGGSRGIGRIIGRALAQEGHVVTSFSRGGGPASGQSAPGVHDLRADLLDASGMAAAADEAVRSRGKPGILVFCQRFRGTGDDWSGEMETSLAATRRLIDHLADRFDEAADRSIVLITSVAGTVVAGEQPLSYHVAKGGMNQLIRYYAVTLGKKGIRVNGIAPGLVLKEETKQHVLKDEELCETYRSLTPLGRLGTSEDIAGVVSFLCGPGACFLTGQILVVDGGLSLLTHESIVRDAVRRSRRPSDGGA